MLDKIYKVFVSSTYEDLRDERAEVQKALLKLNCLPVGMELFPAADDETWEFIKTQIFDSDYYVLLVAGRYGSLAPDGRSFTELEFDYAQEIKKPAIGFVHGNPGQIVKNKSELDPERARKLESFIAKVRLKPVRHFTTPQDLALEVTTSFVDLKARKPAIGFVRADQAVDFKKYSEALEANRALERRVQELSANAGPKLAEWFDSSIQLSLAHFDQNSGKIDYEELVVTWREIMLLTLPGLAQDMPEDEIFCEISFQLLRARLGLHERSGCFLRDGESTIRTKLFVEGIVNMVTERRELTRLQYEKRGSPEPSDEDMLVWKLTEYGKSQLSLLTSESAS
jgi:hypothetical protein